MQTEQDKQYVTREELEGIIREIMRRQHVLYEKMEKIEKVLKMQQERGQER